MTPAPLPHNDAARVRHLHELEILDTPSDPRFDQIALLASQICQTPIALISLVDATRQWFKATTNFDVCQTDRDTSFCGHAILSNEPMVVADALLDPRFADNPLVTGPEAIRFYAGIPLITAQKFCIGTLCVIDRVPRELQPAQLNGLQTLADHIVTLLQLTYDARHDPLTGLPNRWLFEHRLQRCVQRSQRDPSTRFAVLFVDVDDFKLINDGLGHAAGDMLLAEIAERLNRCVRDTDLVCRQDTPDTVARMGGDEFTILLEDLQQIQHAGRVCQRILDAMEAPARIDGQNVNICVSIGVATGGNGEKRSADELLRDADAALYRAKSAGRKRWMMFDASMHQATMKRLRLESDLLQALERREFTLAYQPLVDLRSGRVEGFETLIRWIRDGSPMPPAEFIPVAEESDLIVRIGRWVLADAARQVAAWRQEFPLLGQLWTSVNLSRKQLADPELTVCLCEALEREKLHPSALKMEITESAIAERMDLAQLVSDAIRALGISLCMDDFGTGYSSLSCLHQFPIDVLKIDRQFIHNLFLHAHGKQIVRAIIELGHNLNLKVVAEGVETAEQAAHLRHLGCDMAQGYFFSRPLTATDATEYLRRAALSAA